jgi:hypothetical protein
MRNGPKDRGDMKQIIRATEMKSKRGHKQREQSRGTNNMRNGMSDEVWSKRMGTLCIDPKHYNKIITTHKEGLNSKKGKPLLMGEMDSFNCHLTTFSITIERRAGPRKSLGRRSISRTVRVRVRRSIIKVRVMLSRRCRTWARQN